MRAAILAVVADQLRALGMEDEARWIEYPEAVRELLRHTPTTENAYDELYCVRCDAQSGDVHRPACHVAAAWRALGDPRGQADIERAHEEALTMARQRSDGPRLTAADLLRYAGNLAIAAPGFNARIFHDDIDPTRPLDGNEKWYRR